MKYYHHFVYSQTLSRKILENGCDVKFNLYMHDRSNTLLNDENIKTLTPLPASEENNNLDIDSLFFNRANEIFKTVENNEKKIYVLWSGGIDSTSTLISLLKIVNDYNRIVILANIKKSISEYERFYNEFIKDKIQVINLNPINWASIVNECIKTGVIVTGECGDQIFGSDNYYEYDSKHLTNNWKNYYNSNTIEFFEEHNLKNPTMTNGEVSLKNFLWWNNITLKYQDVQLRIIYSGVKDAIINKNFFNFFDSPEWNSYSLMVDPEERMHKTNIKTYKEPLKRYIRDFTKDDDYYVNKLKVPSLQQLHGIKYAKKPYFYIDEKWNKTYTVE